jgi:hypothetical protein
LREQFKGGLQGRIGLAVYYAFVWALAVRRYAPILSGREVADDLSHWQMALYAAFALSSWWLLRNFRRTSDRIAALLYGLFYAIRIGASFVRGVDASVSLVAACAVISAGMIAVIVGLKQAMSHDLKS